MALPPLGTTLRFVQAKSFRRNRKPGAGDFWIVLHDTESHEGPSAAEDGAQFDAVRTDQTSTNRMCDENSTIQCVPDNCISFAHSPVNDWGKALEICGSVKQSAAEWRDPPGQLEQVAWNVADWWKQKIDAGLNPGALRFLYAEDLVANMRQHGVTTHNEISRASRMPGQVQDWMKATGQGGSDHTDPGMNFYPDFAHRSSIPDTPLGFVLQLANQLLAGQVPVQPVTPTPTPTPTPITPNTNPTANPTEVLVQSLPNVTAGDQGDQVKRVQALLVAAGFAPGDIDGVYTDSPDSPTRTAIIAFQAARGLTQDGNVGIQETWPALLGL
jgi:Putative peptidoglycan binding domain